MKSNLQNNDFKISGQTNPHFLIYKPNSLEYEVEDEDHGSTIRSYFPESWLWDLVLIGWAENFLFLQIHIYNFFFFSKEGETILERNLPDSITTWVTNVLCVSPYKGIGLSHTVEITAFKPFFLDVLTPNSMKIDEILHLSVAVHNYLNHSIPVWKVMVKTDRWFRAIFRNVLGESCIGRKRWNGGGPWGE